MLKNINYRILNIHSVECIEFNFNKIPKIKKETEEKEHFRTLIIDYLDKITFYNKKYVKMDIYNKYKEKFYTFPYNKKEVNRIMTNYKNNSINFLKVRYSKIYMIIQGTIFYEIIPFF